jgi:protein TonB
MSRFNAISWGVAIGLSSTVHLMGLAMIPAAPPTDDERASGKQITVSVAVAAANAFPTPDGEVVTEPAMEATAADVEEPVEPVPHDAREVTSPPMQTATAATAAAEATASNLEQAEPDRQIPLSTTIQVARLADQMSSAQLIESTSDATPVESADNAKSVETTDRTEPVDSTSSVEPVATTSTAKPVKTTSTANPVVKVEKKKQTRKTTKPKKAAKKARKRAEQNSTAKRSASSRSKGANNSNAGSRGKSSRAAGRAKLASYLGRVKSKIRRQNRGAKASGVSVVAFSIAGSGSVLSVRLKKSSGNSTLDKAAVRMVRRAAPFGPIPPDAGRRKLSLSVPIRFRLR